MTDKQIIDPCDKCDVEPPAMKFKCPKCEHNNDIEKIEKSLLYIWSECVLEFVSAKQYKDIQKLFEERIKNV